LLADSSDIIYASEKAKFGQPEVKLGLMPGFAGTVRLPRKAGLGAAAEWTFTGEIYSAADAKEVGLVHKILPPDELMDHVRGIADIISQRAPIAVRASKKAIVNGLGMTPDAAAAAEVEAFGGLFATADAAEGCAAFVEKRDAEWTGE
jgi:enoyl-CoA hydratase